MSSSLERPTERSAFVRFLDAFLREENIKWILGIGVCILLGSSLRLVTTHWHECTPVWKYLILIGYSALVFGLGEFSYHRLGLRKTGTVLMALTTLLIPISFLALHWVRPEQGVASLEVIRSTGLGVLLGFNLAWSAFAAQRIFRHFLRQTQRSFLLSYLALCVAGAIVPGLPTAWAPVLAMALWAVFAAGTVKVNRHVFWLTEEHKLPRIFGFFPIALLGAQFAAVYLLGLMSHISTPWLGLLCTLVAIPILFTADAVARVFEQRTGGIMRPIPWSISGPLVLGTLLCGAGMILAATGFPNSPLIVPTAILAAAAMGVVAHRTRKTAFVWCLVIAVIMAYQTSPVFFQEFALQLRDQAASAVRESKLPYAFYGLTYAPLILVFSLVSAHLQRRGLALFAGPLRQTASVLPWLLLGVSFTHHSAILPVAFVLCPLFVVQAFLFCRRDLVAPAALAFLAAAFGAPGFSQRVLGWSLSAEEALLIWTVAAALLFAPGSLLDRFTRLLPWQSAILPPVPVCQSFSLLVTLISAVICLMQLSMQPISLGFNALTMSVLLTGLLLSAHAVRCLKPGLGEVALTFGSLATLRFILPSGGTVFDLIDHMTAILMVQWLWSYAAERMPHHRLAIAFGRPAMRVSLLGLSGLFSLNVALWMLAHHGFATVPWAVSAVLLVWSLDAGRRLESRAIAAISWSSLFVFSSAAVVSGLHPDHTAAWCLVTWAATGLILLLVRQITLQVMRAADESRFDLELEDAELPAWLSPLNVLLPLVFLLIAAVNLASIGWLERLAGGLALIGLLMARRGRLRVDVGSLTTPLMNWQVLAITATACLPGSRLVFELTLADVARCALPLAACAAGSLLVFQFQRCRRWISEAELLASHELSLAMLSLVLLVVPFQSRAYAQWLMLDLTWAAVAWLSLITTLFISAVRTQAADRAWIGIVTTFAAGLYFLCVGVWSIADPWVAYVVVTCGVLCWSIGGAIARSPKSAILSRPLKHCGLWLPLATVPFAIGKFLAGEPAAWAGANSLPMLMAAAYYFWHGVHHRRAWSTIVSLAIINLTGCLLWTELHWTDPQLFLMPIGISIIAVTELLRREIPSGYHNRLRLIGSLVILVSPTFQIVQGSWLHLVTLMIASVLVALLGIGLRIRVLLYTGTAFLLADLMAIVARGSMDQPNLLWVVGLVIGGLVIALGAFCENHRETLLARLRGMAAALEQWN